MAKYNVSIKLVIDTDDTDLDDSKETVQDFICEELSDSKLADYDEVKAEKQ